MTNGKTDKKPIILSFSGKARHGKDTSAFIAKEILEGKGFLCAHMAYADYLKFIAEKLYGWSGTKDESGRTLLQTLATEVRERNPNFWVDQVVYATSNILPHYNFILISDARYPNEITRWKEQGYTVITIKIVRKNFNNGLTQEQKQHESETALEEYSFDYKIVSANRNELQKKITDLVKEIVNKK